MKNYDRKPDGNHGTPERRIPGIHPKTPVPGSPRHAAPFFPPAKEAKRGRFPETKQEITGRQASSTAQAPVDASNPPGHSHKPGSVREPTKRLLKRKLQ